MLRMARIAARQPVKSANRFFSASVSSHKIVANAQPYLAENFLSDKSVQSTSRSTDTMRLKLNVLGPECAKVRYVQLETVLQDVTDYLNKQKILTNGAEDGQLLNSQYVVIGSSTNFLLSNRFAENWRIGCVPQGFCNLSVKEEASRQYRIARIFAEAGAHYVMMDNGHAAGLIGQLEFILKHIEWRMKELYHEPNALSDNRSKIEESFRFTRNA